jgi:hypothetical protein
VPEDVLCRLATGASIIINFGHNRWANEALGTQTFRDHNLRTPAAIGTRSYVECYHRLTQRRVGQSAERLRK